jgi:WD40 repeat protein
MISDLSSNVPLSSLFSFAGVAFVGSICDVMPVDVEDLQTRMQAGVRDHVARLARRTGGEIRRWSAPTVLGMLCAGAFGPLLAVTAGITGAAAAGIGVLSSVGANVLTDVLKEGIARVRDGGRVSTLEEIEAELQQRIETVLCAGGSQAQQLRGDIAAALRNTGAVGAAVRGAVESGDQELQYQLTSGLTSLSEEFTEFRFLIAEASAALVDIQRGLDQQGAEHRLIVDLLRQQSTQTRLLREEISVIDRYHRHVYSGSDVAARGTAASCPYLGLLPFQEDQAELFYGREQLTIALVQKLAERCTAPGMVVVSGASGAGKSSLLRAGLLPALGQGVLTDQAAAWPRLVMTPTSAPLDELATHLAALAGLEASVVRDSLAKGPDEIRLLVHQAVIADAARSGESTGLVAGSRLMVVIDQFEEIFSLTKDLAQREAFITVLDAASRPSGTEKHPPALVVIAVRGDYWDRCAAYPELTDALQSGQFVVGPMAEPDLRRAITGPADAAGLQIEPRLVDAILGELRSATGEYAAGALPLLSQTMLSTWENREGNRLTSRGYGLAGGVRHAVQTSAEASFARLNPRQQALAREVFRILTVVTPEGQLARRPVLRAELQADRTSHGKADLGCVLDAFAAKRLMVLGDGVVEIAHDALLTGWPRLRSWLEDDKADGILYSRLLDDADEWNRHHREPSFLYRGTRLAAVQQARLRWESDARYPALTGKVRAFLHASRRAANRGTRRRMATISLLAVLAVVALLAAGTANVQSRNRSEERDRSASRSTALRSETMAASDPALSQLLAVAAWRIWPTPEARRAMLAAMIRPARTTIPRPSDECMGMASSKDGRTIATSDRDGVRIWNPSAQRQSDPILRGECPRIALSPNGKILFVSDGKSLRRWDIAAHREAGTIKTGRTSSFAISPDGKTIATADGSAVRVWDPQTGRPAGPPITRFSPPGRTKYINPGEPAIVFSPDGHTAAITIGVGNIGIWVRDAGHWRQNGVVRASNGTGLAIALSPDGKMLAAADPGQQGPVRIWDVATKRETGALKAGWTQTVAFSPDGATLATGGNDAVKLWDIRSRKLLNTFARPSNFVAPIAFTADRQMLISATDDAVWIFDIPPTGTFKITEDPGSIDEHASPRTDVIELPDGRVLLALGGANGIQIWDVTRHEKIASLPGTRKIRSMAWSPDGRTLAIAGADVILWDIRAQRQISVFRGIHADVLFSPDGKTLVGFGTHSADLWDISTGHLIGKLPQGPGINGSESFSADGRLLAIGGQGSAGVWDMRTRRKVAAFNERMEYGSTVTLSADGDTLATIGSDSSVRLFSVSTKRRLGNPIASGRTSGLARAAFSPDGKELAIIANDHDVELWDVATQQEISRMYLSRFRNAQVVSFDRDGLFLLGYDGFEMPEFLFDPDIAMVALRWNVDLSGNPVPILCARAGRFLTSNEWSTYITDTKYRDTCP